MSDNRSDRRLTHQTVFLLIKVSILLFCIGSLPLCAADKVNPSSTQAPSSIKQLVGSILTTATQPVRQAQNNSETTRPLAEPTKTPLPMPDWASHKLSPEEIEQHRGEPGVVRLNWKTQSEENCFGFNLMRGDNKEGKNFKAANPKIILGAGNSSTENSYEFFDTNVKVGESYYYYIEQIDMNGHREAKLPILPLTVRYRNLRALKERTAPSADATTHSLQPVLKTIELAKTSTPADRNVAAVQSLTPTPTLTATATATPAVTPTASPTPTPTSTPQASPSATATATPSPTMPGTPEPSPMAKPASDSIVQPGNPGESLRIRFALRSDRLNLEARAVLDRLAQTLKANPSARVTISGHSDSTGTPAANQSFAERRAWNAREYLMEQGVLREQLLLGTEVLHQSAEEANDATRMAENRRVEFVFRQPSTAPPKPEAGTSKSSDAE